MAPYLALCHEVAEQREYSLVDEINNLKFVLKTSNKRRVMPLGRPP